MSIPRLLDIKPIENSLFLFGARQTGKTWFLKHNIKYDLYIDLLKKSELIRYSNNPALINQEIAAIGKKNAIVVIDEIQKAPGLLDEIHRGIESDLKPYFILTGSSARKLKRNQANMLGGRAYTYNLFPFSYIEIKDRFILEDFLQYGGIPSVFLADKKISKQKLLQSYVNTYLKEEIADEALTRDLPSFSMFLDIAASENGNVLNYSNIACDIGVNAKTVKEYYAILEDTLLGFYLRPFHRSLRKRLVAHPKFYFNDTGLVFALKKIITAELLPHTSLFGDAFEHFIITELKKLITYFWTETTMSYFRTFDGTEVDIILEKHNKLVAIEIKSSPLPRSLPGLKSFLRDHKADRAICVCLSPRKFIQNNILFLPWQEFLENFATGEII